MINKIKKHLEQYKNLIEEHTTNLELIESHKKGKLEYFKILNSGKQSNI